MASIILAFDRNPHEFAINCFLFYNWGITCHTEDYEYSLQEMIDISTHIP